MGPGASAPLEADDLTGYSRASQLWAEWPAVAGCSAHNWLVGEQLVVRGPVWVAAAPGYRVRGGRVQLGAAELSTGRPNWAMSARVRRDDAVQASASGLARRCGRGRDREWAPIGTEGLRWRPTGRAGDQRMAAIGTEGLRWVPTDRAEDQRMAAIGTEGLRWVPTGRAEDQRMAAIGTEGLRWVPTGRAGDERMAAIGTEGLRWLPTGRAGDREWLRYVPKGRAGRDHCVPSVAIRRAAPSSGRGRRQAAGRRAASERESRREGKRAGRQRRGRTATRLRR